MQIFFKKKYGVTGYRGRGYRLQVTGYGAKLPILTILDKSTIDNN
jgi:hypothetical protein